MPPLLRSHDFRGLTSAAMRSRHVSWPYKQLRDYAGATRFSL